MTDPVAPRPEREMHHCIPGEDPETTLFLRHLAPEGEARGVVLYVHGATFPSALSVGYRFDGWSWADELAREGFHVWALDFHGFGHSGRPPAMDAPAADNPPIGRAADAERQIARAVRFIGERFEHGPIHLIAHSWGCIAAGRFASAYPDLVDRLVLFAPISLRQAGAGKPFVASAAGALPAWVGVSAEAQWRRFTEDVPPGAPAVLRRRHFDLWAAEYLATDPQAGRSDPPSVRVPAGGAMADIQAARSGDLAYDPGAVRAPTLIVRGEWDSLCSDADARWLFDSLRQAPIRRDVKIDRATHLMHLEDSRFALYRETVNFLAAGDTVPCLGQGSSEILAMEQVGCSR